MTSGIAISRSTWRDRIVHSDSPAARAKRTVSVSITSRVPARASRIIMANLNSARFKAGRNRCAQPFSVRKLHSTPSSVTVAPRPPAGSQPSVTAKVRISTSPTQKVGTEKPRIDSAMMPLASALPGR